MKIFSVAFSALYIISLLEVKAQCLSWKEIQSIERSTLRERDIIFEAKGLHLYDDSGSGENESVGWRNQSSTSQIRLISEVGGGLGVEYQFTNAQCYEAIYYQVEASGSKKICETSFSGMIAYVWLSADGKKDITLMKGAKRKDGKEYKVYIMLVMKHRKEIKCE